jgi:hypothetical protein
MVWFTVQAKTTLVEHIPTTINEDPTVLCIRLKQFHKSTLYIVQCTLVHSQSEEQNLENNDILPKLNYCYKS